MKFNIFIFSFDSYALSVKLKLLFKPRSQRFIPIFYPNSFIVSDFTCSSLIHFELILYMDPLLYVDIQFSQHRLPKRLNGLGTLVKNHLPIFLFVCLLPPPMPLVCMSVFMPVPHCFDYHSFAINLEGSVRSATLFYFKIVLAT